MKFTEIANRLTGISTPFGGASWQPAELEIAGAHRVIAFLEDRRVLYDPCQMEVPDHCVRSVIEIRHCLTEELGKLEGGSELAASLRAMRAACRKFLERVGEDGREGVRVAKGSLTQFTCDTNSADTGTFNGFIATNIYIQGPSGEQMTELVNDSGSG